MHGIKYVGVIYAMNSLLLIVKIVCLFVCVCFTSQSTIFQPCQDDFLSPWAEPLIK